MNGNSDNLFSGGEMKSGGGFYSSPGGGGGQFDASEIIDRLRSNSRGYWRENRIFIYIFLLALLADALSTVHFMVQIGPEAELHPAVRICGHVFGAVSGPLIAACCKGFACFAVTLYLRRQAALIFIAASVIYFWAAWYNFS